MEFIEIILSAIASILAIFLLVKLIGNRQMSEMNLFDYINGITIGSIAAEMATDLDGNPIFTLTAMILYALAACLIEALSSRSLTARRFLNGKSRVLMSGGKLYKKSFKDAKLDLHEFLAQSRINGFFRLSDIETAILEQNGRISFQPKANARPATPSDLKIITQPETLSATIIADGVVFEDNLRAIGKDKNWLKAQLDKVGVGDSAKVFLALAEDCETLRVFNEESQKPVRDVL